MARRKKKDLEVVAKAEGKTIAGEEKTAKVDEPVKNHISGLEVRTVELPPEPANKRKEKKEGARNAPGKAGRKKTRKTKNGVQRARQGDGEKTKVPGVTITKREKRPFWPSDF